MCVLFCGDKNDSFDPQCCSDDIVLEDNDLIATNGRTTGRVYLSNIIESGVHRWKFKILRQRGVQIGVWKTNHKCDKAELMHQSLRSFHNFGTSYAFITDDAETSHGDGHKRNT